MNKSTISHAVITGLTTTENYVSPSEETQLINTITRQSWDKSLSRWTQHYGYRYDYSSKSVKTDNCTNPFPLWLDQLAQRLVDDGHFLKKPDQIIINRYLPGEGISPHVDRTDCFDNIIASISLGSQCNITYTGIHGQGSYPVHLKPRALLVMKDNARYKYRHGIRDSMSDNINFKKILRGTRYSITFRNVIKTQ